jgi:2'-5' RNA ligase
VAQSVELLLDDGADAAIRRQWRLLAEAGLPSEQRTGSVTHHRPHLTLFAAGSVPSEAEQALPGLVAGLDLSVQVGAVMMFGPRRGRVILVRQVTASLELLELQSRVASACLADPTGQFGPGRWTPHVTLARRVPLSQVPDALEALGPSADRPVSVRITRCRRWDGTRKTAWML